MFDCFLSVNLICAAPTIAKVDRQCPQELAPLTSLLLRDLPGYANRVAQRRRKKLDPNYSSYVAAGRPETIPQIINNPEYRPANPQAAPLQLYFSTLERQYAGGKSIDLQQFHWLFLAKGKKDWHIVTMYSRLGKDANDPLLLPPLESLTSPVGEAVKIWLRDCNAGKIQP
jgi:hypothetical protein